MDVVGPLRGIVAGAAQHQTADGVDQSGFLSNGNEFARRDHATLGVRPTHQRFEAGDAPTRKIDQWLVMGPQRIALDGRAQLGFDLAAVWARASIPVSKNENVPRESFLARDNARSAFFKTFSDSSPSPGASAMPMLAPITTECPSRI